MQLKIKINFNVIIVRIITEILEKLFFRFTFIFI